MTRSSRRAAGQVLVTACLGGAIAAGGVSVAASSETVKAPRFSNSTRIDNPYLPLSEITRSVLRGTKDGKQVRSVITPLKRTKLFRVHGERVRALVMKDRASENGVLHEVALDYYAQADDGTVHYLGEDVDIYNRTGTRVTSHEGAFLYGRDTRTLGVAMPEHPRAGRRFVFERVPGQGSERNRVVATKARLNVPAGTYTRALKVRSYHLPDAEREIKWYARGVGLLKEQGPTGSVELLRPAEASSQVSTGSRRSR